MWIAEMLRDAPRGAWLAVAASWVRTASLAAAAVAAGLLVDAALAERSIVPAALWSAALATIGAVAGAVAEAIPGRMQGVEEASWRARVMAAGMRGTIRVGESGHGATAAPPPASGAEGAHPARAAEGMIADAATGAVEKIGGYRATFLAPTFASFTAPLAVLVAWAVGVDWRSALALATFVALVPIVIATASKLLRGSNAEYRRREAQAAARYLELLEGLGTIKVLGAFDRVWREYAQSARNAMAELGRLLARNQTTIIVNDAVFGLLMSGAAIALILAGTATGSLTAGAAFAGVLLTVLLVEPIDRVGRTFYVGLAGRARRDQVERMLPPADSEAHVDARSAWSISSRAEQPADSDPSTPSSPGPGIPADLDLRDITVLHPDGTAALRGIDLRIPAGARVSLVGPTGAGKSTLLRVIAGLQAPTAGEVRVGGAPRTPAELRANMTLVAQHAGLLSTTVADNLRLAAPGASDAELRDALDRAHLGAELEHRALDARVGNAGAHLSGGQRRRLTLARALLRARPVLLLDEATADLDRRTEALVRESLREAAVGRTVVQVAHRLAMTADSDLVVVLDGGRIIDQGTPAELRASGGYYRDAIKAEATT
ncbi:ATP-binding cassette domain-containing protein [Gulosibacter sediminis]|uniref:ATP-binding cassette domain-containing protein n=1 Tax=Gulosibacter sediminis TaxID=1729695 RepID=UPI0024AE3485|nr:ATP-binding cassette domain-containing protein [Gulosibacter sediminis]